jgi:hypothetical protein
MAKLERNPIRFDHPNIVIPGPDPGITLHSQQMAGSSPTIRIQVIPFDWMPL